MTNIRQFLMQDYTNQDENNGLIQVFMENSTNIGVGLNGYVTENSTNLVMGLNGYVIENNHDISNVK